MSANVHTWIDGHLAVRQRAYEVRGAIQLDTGARRPRTSGADVISIAAVFDDAIRMHGAPGVLLRWHATLADIEQDALVAPGETYAENRTFWSTLEIVAIFLDDIAVTPPPAAVWDTLLLELGNLRNVAPTEDSPIAHFDGIKTYDDLWNAQRTFLATKRGSDRLSPPAGMTGAGMDIPRTTNQDVLQLATYWSDQLAKAKQVMGYAGVVAKWKPVMDDVDTLAKSGDATAVYPKNNEFWRGAFDVAVQVAIGDEAPSRWDMAVDSVKDSVKQLPQTIESGVGKGVEVIEDGARAVGKAVGEAGKCLVSALGTPVLIGAGLLGLFLLTRRGDSSKREDA